MILNILKKISNKFETNHTRKISSSNKSVEEEQYESYGDVIQKVLEEYEIKISDESFLKVKTTLTEFTTKSGIYVNDIVTSRINTANGSAILNKMFTSYERVLMPNGKYALKTTVVTSVGHVIGKESKMFTPDAKQTSQIFYASDDEKDIFDNGVKVILK